MNYFAGCDFNFEGKLVGCEGKGEGGADPIGGGVGNIGSKTSTQCSKHCLTMFKTLFDIVQNINKLFNIDADSVQYEILMKTMANNVQSGKHCVGTSTTLHVLKTCPHQRKQLVPNKGIYPRKSLLVELSEKVRPGQTRGLK